MEGERVDAEARLPKLPRRVIEVLSRQEVQRMEDAADSERGKLIARLLANTGLRVGELVKLRQPDLLERDRSWNVRVQGKGERERLVPMSPALARRVRCYAERAHRQPCPIQPRYNVAAEHLHCLSESMVAGLHEPLIEVEALVQSSLPLPNRLWRAALASRPQGRQAEVLVRVLSPLGYRDRLRKQYEENRLRAPLDPVEHARAVQARWHRAFQAGRRPTCTGLPDYSL